MDETKSETSHRDQYDIFEVLPSGSQVYRASTDNVEEAWGQLRELEKQTANECFALHRSTHRVAAQVNVPLAKQKARKLVFQIAYTEDLAYERAKVLRSRGYRVTTVIGNGSATAVLDSLDEEILLFMVGHGAPYHTRKAMVEWLRAKYPDIKILALNPVHQELEDADFNVILNGPEEWLPFVAQAAS